MALKVIGPNGLEVVNRHTKVGGVNYFWPAAAGAGVLMGDASANLAWNNSPALAALSTTGTVAVGGALSQTAGNNLLNTTSGNTNVGYAADQGVKLAVNGAIIGTSVGVRVTSPATALHLKQSANSAAGAFRIERADNTNRWDQYVDGSNNLIYLYNGGATYFIVDAAGRANVSGGYGGILGTDLAASPVSGNKLQWNDAATAMEWAKQSNVSNWSAILGSNQVHTSQGGFVMANLSAAQYDGLQEFDGVNHRIVVRRAGVYCFFGSMYASAPAVNTRIIMSLFINSVERVRLFDWTTGPVTDYIPSAGGMYVLAAGDAVQLGLYQSMSSTTFVANYTKLDGFRIA